MKELKEIAYQALAEILPDETMSPAEFAAYHKGATRVVELIVTKLAEVNDEPENARHADLAPSQRQEIAHRG